MNILNLITNLIFVYVAANLLPDFLLKKFIITTENNNFLFIKL